MKCTAPMVVAVAALAGTLLASPAIGADDLLPDLVQEPPSDIQLTRARGRDLLGFRSAVHNVGPGALVIVGSRANRSIRDMRADQVITQSDGSTRRERAVGFVRYVPSPDHSHWHFLPFERYELFREGSVARVVRDRKSGFCLGDRYRVESVTVGAVPAKYIGRCQLNRPGRLSLTEGISVGWGDDYAAYLEGQYVDVTGLPLGRYRLVHTVNSGGRILEANRSNNASEVVVRLSRSASGRLRVAVVAP